MLWEDMDWACLYTVVELGSEISILVTKIFTLSPKYHLVEHLTQGVQRQKGAIYAKNNSH